MFMNKAMIALRFIRCVVLHPTSPARADDNMTQTVALKHNQLWPISIYVQVNINQLNVIIF